MICRVDFEDLFPDLFRPEPDPASHQMAKPPCAACIARWEDDGARILTAARHGRAASGRRSQYNSYMPVLASAGAMAAILPAAVAFGAVSVMQTTYHRMTHGHPAYENDGRH